MLLDRLETGQYKEILHIATHLSNLLKVSERVGQNERSLVTFLAGNEKGTLSDYVNSERDAKQCMTPGRVFDYFSPLLKRDL